MMHRENNEYLYDNDSDSFKWRREARRTREITSEIVRSESVILHIVKIPIGMARSYAPMFTFAAVK